MNNTNKNISETTIQQLEFMRQRRRITIVIVVSVLLILTAVVGWYLSGWIRNTGRFLPNTYINGINISRMELMQAVDELDCTYEHPDVTITQKDGSVMTIHAADYDYHYDILSKVKPIYYDIDYSRWYQSYFKPNDYTIEVQPEYDINKLFSICQNNTWGSKINVDAKLVCRDNSFSIKDEEYGDFLESDDVASYVVDCFKKGIYDVDLRVSGLYTEPSVKAIDLLDELTELNNEYHYTITYDFNYAIEQLTGWDIYNWRLKDGTIDRSKVEEYVAMLAKKYDTFGTTRKFRSTSRGDIYILQGQYSMGQYGWWTDQERTVNKLLKYIDMGQDMIVEPEYVVLPDSGYTYKGVENARSLGDDIGNTYIEVDLSSQHMWYYKNGNLEFETDQIVSGLFSDPDRKTPGGIFSVYAKNKDYTMKAPTYSVKCKYFMRISFEGVGFHDLNRSSYGGSTYLTNGSHGCINMKLDEVEKLYNMVELGTPVIMYY